MNKTKIIVVEDNIVYCEYVCNMLSREGYHTMKAYHLSTAKKHLQQANGNRSVAAELLGIGRTTLYSKLEEYGLKYKFKQS